MEVVSVYTRVISRHSHLRTYDVECRVNSDWKICREKRHPLELPCSLTQSKDKSCSIPYFSEGGEGQHRKTSITVVGVPDRYQNRAHPGFKSESLPAEPERSVTNDSTVGRQYRRRRCTQHDECRCRVDVIHGLVRIVTYSAHTQKKILLFLIAIQTHL